jgi:hypothetical protein
MWKMSAMAEKTMAFFLVTGKSAAIPLSGAGA